MVAGEGMVLRTGDQLHAESNLTQNLPSREVTPTMVDTTTELETAPDDTAPPIAIVLIEDNRLVREGIMALLNEIDGLCVVASGDGEHDQLWQETQPTVVLLDLGLQDGDSLRIAQRVRTDLPDAGIILMDLLPMYEDIVEFVNVGVRGFIMKDATLEDLIETIRSVANGGHVLPPQMTSTLFSKIAQHAVVSGRSLILDSVRLTPREQQVINLIAEGLSNKEIATSLSIATHTVKSHVRNVMEKLALHTRLQIAAYAHRSRSDLGAD
jgi:DNA-binding NarL/FixJ family response regulator